MKGGIEKEAKRNIVREWVKASGGNRWWNELVRGAWSMDTMNAIWRTQDPRQNNKSKDKQTGCQALSKDANRSDACYNGASNQTTKLTKYPRDEQGARTDIPAHG